MTAGSPDREPAEQRPSRARKEADNNDPRSTIERPCRKRHEYWEKQKRLWSVTVMAHRCTPALRTSIARWPTVKTVGHPALRTSIESAMAHR
jgi:hypothetical protein